MNLKLAIQFVLFLGIALFATYRLDLLHDAAGTSRERIALLDLYRRLDDLERMKRHEDETYTNLNRHRNSLAGIAAAYLPDPADPYAWASQQIQYLAQQSGVQIETSKSGPGPRLRSSRDAPPRQFSVYRSKVECAGSLEQILAFARAAEERNPHLIVSDLMIGPTKEEGGQRYGSVSFDWPAWHSVSLRDDLLEDIDQLAESSE